MAEVPIYVQDAIDKILKEQNIVNYDLRSVVGSKKGDNHLANLIKIQVLEKNPKNNKMLIRKHFICKLAPKNEARRKHMNIRLIYKREAIVYRDVLSEFEKLQSEKEISEFDKFDAVPKCYHTSINECEEFILLNDLTFENYEMYDRFKVITLDHAKLALEQLGKFHAFSLVLRDQKPDVFKELAENLKDDNLFPETVDDLIIKYGTIYYQRLLPQIMSSEEILNKDEVYKKVSFIHDHLREIMTSAVKRDEAEPYAVFCHGDFWNNNILYSYDENNKPIDAKLLDFQLARCSSPILDISFYLLCCIEKEIREPNFDLLKNAYYESLSKQINILGSNAKQLYPRAIYEEHLNKFFVYGFGMTVFAIPYFIAEPIDVPNLDAVASRYEENQKNKAENGEKAEKTENGDDKKAVDENGQNGEIAQVMGDLEILTQKTTPIFRKRIIDVILDMEKFDLWSEKWTASLIKEKE